MPSYSRAVRRSAPSRQQQSAFRVDVSGEVPSQGPVLQSADATAEELQAGGAANAEVYELAQQLEDLASREEIDLSEAERKSRENQFAQAQVDQTSFIYPGKDDINNDLFYPKGVGSELYWRLDPEKIINQAFSGLASNPCPWEAVLNAFPCNYPEYFKLTASDRMRELVLRSSQKSLNNGLVVKELQQLFERFWGLYMDSPVRALIYDTDELTGNNETNGGIELDVFTTIILQADTHWIVLFFDPATSTYTAIDPLSDRQFKANYPRTKKINYEVLKAIIERKLQRSWDGYRQEVIEGKNVPLPTEHLVIRWPSKLFDVFTNETTRKQSNAMAQIFISQVPPKWPPRNFLKFEYTRDETVARQQVREMFKDKKYQKQSGEEKIARAFSGDPFNAGIQYDDEKNIKHSRGSFESGSGLQRTSQEKQDLDQAVRESLASHDYQKG